MSTRTAFSHSLTSALLIGLLAMGSPTHAIASNFKSVSEAAAAGDARSQTVLGNMYHDGWGVDKDITKALEWYRKAADQGYAEGQFALGHEYATGHGVPADAAKAIELFRKAAEQGHGQAQYRLGTYYHEGKHVPQDLGKTLYWYSLASENDWHEAQVLMADHYLAQGEQAQALALFEKAASRNADASTRAAVMHYHGIGTPVDYAKAAGFASDARSRNVHAKALYGHLLLEGKGVTRNLDSAEKYLTEAAEEGQPNAMFWLADAMYAGVIVTRAAELAAAYNNTSTRELMKKEARKWYERAALHGDEDAKKKLRENYR